MKGRRRTRADRAVPGRADPKGHCRTRKNHPAPTDHRVHRDRQDGRAHQDGRGRRDPVRPVHRVRGRRVHRGRRIRRCRPGPRGRRRTAVPGGSARRDGSPARGGSSGSRTRHRRRRTAGAAAAGTAAPGSRRHPDPDPDRGRDHRDRDPGRGQGRVPRAGARPGCRSSRCWSGSSTGTPRRRARRPRGACGTAGRAPARRRGAGVHRAHQGRRDPRGRLRPEAGEGSRAAGIRNRRPGAAVEAAAGVRHRPYGDRRPRTSRRNPTGVRSGRSACRRFPLSFPTSRPVPVAATGRCGVATSLHEQSLWTGSRESSRRPP